MPRLYLVRHGEAAAGWTEADPGLSEVGRQQAEAAADWLEPKGPLPMIVSPLRRCRETSAVLEQRWGVEAVVTPAVGEIESPDPDLATRTTWLRTAMAGLWADLPDHRPWHRGVIDALAALDADTVVMSHFIAINVAVGHATSDDRVVCFTPGNCSITVLDTDGDTFEVVELGGQAPSRVL